MATRPELRTHEQDRIAQRAGSSGVIATGLAPDTNNLAEMLASAAPASDEAHWVYAPAERVQILRVLLVADGSPWLARFGLLMTLSVLIASLGLANDQPAAVIAAMVVAPMMTPVLGMAAALTLGLFRQTLRLALIVALSSLLAVGFAWVISSVLVVSELTGEELSRTTPRLRDLVIALAAGTAGMYSVVRKDLSGVVPGVAIAVALVPPLATIGIVLERREWTLARGAALLYGVNVLAVIGAAVVVLLVTDFIASPSVRDPRVLAFGAVLVVAAVAVVVPVWGNSRAIDRDTSFVLNVSTVLEEWSATHPAHRLVDTQIEPGNVRLVIAGGPAPGTVDFLRSEIADTTYPDPVIEVDWVPGLQIEVSD